jgi:hypothetical protein
MLKVILSILGGLIVAFLSVFASDWAFHALVPSSMRMPSELAERNAMAAYVARQPTSVLAGLAVGWAVAAFVGSAMATRFAARGEWPGWVVGALFLLATASNFFMIPHPAWMVAFAIMAIASAALVGSRIGAGAWPRAPA